MRGPSTPVAGSPKTNRPGARTGPRGAPLGEDPTSWRRWWTRNQDRFLDPRAEQAAFATTQGDDFYLGATMRPEREIEEDHLDRVRPKVAEALRSVIDSAHQPGLISRSLIALGRLARHDDALDLASFRSALRHPHAQVRASAALALGISGRTAGLPALLRVLDGQTASGGREQLFVRIFAAYGVGLAAGSETKPHAQKFAFEMLRSVLDDAAERPELRQAAVHAIRMIGPNRSDRSGEALATACVESLRQAEQRARRDAEHGLAAHIPPAIAALLGRGRDVGTRHLDEFAQSLDPRHRAPIQVRRGAAIALGQLARSGEETPSHAHYSDVLWQYHRKGHDQLTRLEALVAIARIGGTKNRDLLLRALGKGSRSNERPWTALALGVLAREMRRGGETDPTLERALLEELQSTKNSELISACAIGLGLAKCKDAAPALIKLLERYRKRADLAGHLCVALGMVGDRRATETILATLEDADRRPEVLEPAALALAQIGDASTAKRLLQWIDLRSLPTLESVGFALGRIADESAVPQLLGVLQDAERPAVARSCAAIALGGIVDPVMIDWKSRLCVDGNEPLAARR